jgi:hypothetical protein
MPNGQTSQFYSTHGIVFGTTNVVRLADRGSSDVQNSRTRNTPLGSFLFPTHHSLFSTTLAFSWSSSGGRRLVVWSADSCAIGCPSRDTGAYWLGVFPLGDASSPCGFHSWSVRRHCVRFIRDAHLAASPRPTASAGDSDRGLYGCEGPDVHRTRLLPKGACTIRGRVCARCTRALVAGGHTAGCRYTSRPSRACACVRTYAVWIQCYCSALLR